jgi:predicted RNase H-like HicB family nuclease
MVTYVALIRKAGDTVFRVEFPDFPACTCSGSTLADAGAEAKTALERHVEHMRQQGKPIPNPTELEEIRTRPEAMDTAPVQVEIEIGRKQKRVNITMEEGLLEEVDAEAAATGTTRSGFLASAARQALLDVKDPRSS